MKHFLTPLVCLLSLACCSQSHTLHVITTDDVHGAWFDSSYVGGSVKPSLFAINSYADSIRRAVGKDNVLLLDAGDCLQGDNAAYYYNYVDTLAPHLFPRLVSYMGYDAVTVGNHDVETGHGVYDRVTRELEAAGIPFLAGNALRPDGTPYWSEYKVFHRAGMKVLVLGYTNPNNPAWLDESIWSGMHFVSLLPFVQQRVDKLKAETKPDVTIVCVHSGVGEGDGSMLENQGLDLFKSLRGVDLLVTAHDHRPRLEKTDSIILVNAGSKARWYTHSVITVGRDGSRRLDCSLQSVDPGKADPAMRDEFREDFEKVRAFTLRQVGTLGEDLLSRDAFRGKCFYTDLIHYVQLKASGADVSFAAPLSFDVTIPAGRVIYNDMFTLYPYENSLCVMRLSGKEIRNYLEYSYDKWIGADNAHILRISEGANLRYSGSAWSFDYPSFNFDSAAGLDYSVDVRKPFGSRIRIKSLSDGSAFDENALYSVAMTSYRAAGGGDLLEKGADIPREDFSSRMISRGGDLRDLVYRLFLSSDVVTPESLTGLGEWRFVPEKLAGEGIDADMALLFP